MQLRFDWDKKKAETNQRKHGISFDEAQSVFTDDLSIIVPDPDHSSEEDRAIIIGSSRSGHMLVVCFVERGDVFRLISARKATRIEREKYEQTSL
jgi:uncharacterized protein